MNAPLDNSQMKMLMAETMSYRAPVTDPVERTTWSTSIRSVITSFVQSLRRYRVLNELTALTDRELADIGLNRADLGRVFDQQFVAQRHYR